MLPGLLDCLLSPPLCSLLLPAQSIPAAAASTGLGDGSVLLGAQLTKLATLITLPVLRVNGWELAHCRGRLDPANRHCI